jgi:hypothetical protein
MSANINCIFSEIGQKSQSRKIEITIVRIRRTDHATPSPQTLALTSLTSGGRSVGKVRLRTKAKEFSFLIG